MAYMAVLANSESHIEGGLRTDHSQATTSETLPLYCRLHDARAMTFFLSHLFFSLQGGFKPAANFWKLGGGAANGRSRNDTTHT